MRVGFRLYLSFRDLSYRLESVLWTHPHIVKRTLDVMSGLSESGPDNIGNG